MSISIAAAASPDDDSITGLLAQLRQGNLDAKDRLISQVYDELRRLARAHMRRERFNHTLQATDLVGIAYERMAHEPHPNWQNRAHFFAAASNVMRQILVDYARKRRAIKRGGENIRVTLTDAIARTEDHTVDVLALNEALERLEELDPRQAHVVELHYFSGLNHEEISLVLGVSSRTVKRDWEMARSWLRIQLRP
jgi:RNA polymerase sigma-70 factor (ECF subfamily)